MKRKIISILALILLGLSAWAYTACSIIEPKELPYGKKQIVLTIDDGPSEVITEEILEVLESHQVKAMFCFVGNSVEEHPEVVTKALNQGHELGSHSMAHCTETLLTYEGLKQEVEQYQALIDSLPTKVPYTMTYFRPPYGILTPPVKMVVAEKGLKYAYVTTYVYDSSLKEEKKDKFLAELQRRLTRDQGGAIVLHESHYRTKGGDKHVDKSWFPEMLNEFIVWAHAEGFEFVGYDDLIR